MDDRDKIKKLLGPALGVGAIIVLVAVVMLVGQPSTAEKPETPGRPAGRPHAAAPKTLSDGTAPGAADPDLKDIGDGLKVRDLKEGEGPEVRPMATVVMHYTGWLTDGTSFDSSRTRGEPLESPLGRLIQGWQKAIPGMKPGGVRKLVIPPELGYGSQRNQGIPANSTLVFEVELVSSH